MKTDKIMWVVIIGVSLMMSCNSSDGPVNGGKMIAENRIMQQKDGTISLKIDKAECYHDKVNPSTNTAEWNMFVSKTGRYEVWLSSATKDTTDLKYRNSVLLSIRDNRFEMRPKVNRVIQNSSDVPKPYYQADSFLGSLYIQDTGVYNVQVISDRILPKDAGQGGASDDDQTKIVSVSLTPAKH
jgi:hypothetical protein